MYNIYAIVILILFVIPRFSVNDLHQIQVAAPSPSSRKFLASNIGLRQGSALNPLLFIMVMELISMKISTKDVLRKMIYADNLAIIAESKQELQEVLEEWKGVFKKHGMRLSLEKTEVMRVVGKRLGCNVA